ncbi:MAG: hypothetical protein ACTH1D_09855, partial [Mycobacteriaceae bacterium]
MPAPDTISQDGAVDSAPTSAWDRDGDDGDPADIGPGGRRSDADRWMDDALRLRSGTKRLNIFTPALEIPRRMRRFVSTTPGLLS